MTTEPIALIIAAAIGVVSALFTVLLGRYFDNKNKILATKREQFEKVFAPLDVLSKVNKSAFQRFIKNDDSISEVTQEDIQDDPQITSAGATTKERDFIEQSVWYPNNLEIRNIIMSNSHLLPEMPKQFLTLLEHINLWLFVYELKYMKKEYTGPVFAGPRGTGYPVGIDKYIFDKADEYRKLLNK